MICTFKTIQKLVLSITLIICNQAIVADQECTKRESVAERITCQNTALSALAKGLSQKFALLNAATDDQGRQILLITQKHWYETVLSVCDSETCIWHAYWSRMAELLTFRVQSVSLPAHDTTSSQNILKILATKPLQEETLNEPTACRKLLVHLKTMDNIKVIEPDIQSIDYENPKFDSLKHSCETKLPLNLQVLCEPHTAHGNGEPMDGMIPNDPYGIQKECMVYYGTPPFRFYELAALQAKSKPHRVLYSDNHFGPMNQNWRQPTLGRGSGFTEIDTRTCEGLLGGSFLQTESELNPNNRAYNIIFSYEKEYYMLGFGLEFDRYSMDVRGIDSRQLCTWKSFPVESDIKGVK